MTIESFLVAESARKGGIKIRTARVFPTIEDVKQYIEDNGHSPYYYNIYRTYSDNRPKKIGYEELKDLMARSL